MKVTVGAIRQIVREEAERLHETGETVEVEAEASAEGAPGSLTDSAMVVWAKSALMDLLDPIKDQWNDEIKRDIELVISNWLDPQVGKVAGRKLAALSPNEGSSQTAGFTPGDSGRASNESVNRSVLRNMIMGEAAAIVRK